MDVEVILRALTLKEKIELCSGADFWKTKALPKHGIPAVFMCDGPHGLRKQPYTKRTDMLGIHASLPATCFPAAVTTGGSWDPDLLERIGRAIGEEARAQGVRLVLGPGANIKRSPLCGRNFEYFSEDPYVTGKLAAAFIRGLQSTGTAASLKHFAFNNQEYRRFNSDSVMDERTAREIYLTGFEIAVKEGRPETVMCAYNKINGVHLSDSKRLLTDILRDEWGFDGMVVTDWGGMHDRIEAFRAGCDLNMPGGSRYMERATYKAVKRGQLDEAAIDRSVCRVLRWVFRQNDEDVPASIDMDAHHVLARKAAEQGAVLLKNEDRLLPLRPSQSVAWIGAMAEIPRYQGAGSSHIHPTRCTSALDALPKDVAYAAGCDADGTTTDTLIREATECARSHDVAVVFVGLPDRYESEGFDRDHMRMPEGHLRLVDAVARANPNTVVVLSCGSPVACPWADDVKAVLYMGLAGQASGEAAVNLLTGKANPSGKLTESWPFTFDDTVLHTYYPKHKNAQYREGIYVGYRYYDRAEVPVRFAFGHGLSYTTFDYSNLRRHGRVVTVTLTNTGDVAGAEIAQLYVVPPAGGLHRPKKELKGFRKIRLEPGECRDITFELDDRTFAVWRDGWKIPIGTYTLAVGAASDDLRQRLSVDVDGVDVPVPAWQPGSWYEHLRGIPSKEAWEAMLGYKYIEAPLVKGQFTKDHSMVEMARHSKTMRFMTRFVERIIFKGTNDHGEKAPEHRMLLASSIASPLRALKQTSGIKTGLFRRLLKLANFTWRR
ncbi:MAG: glycoside hydrolase family 3 C-terminal domain-containing protein [Saccharofermentanales bacterium]|jgi:beta-glucosidase